jgi:hypothetical protein
VASKKDFTDKWMTHTAEERRARLNELGSIVEKSDDEQREHDALATVVAQDETAALDETAKDENG